MEDTATQKVQAFFEIKKAANNKLCDCHPMSKGSSVVRPKYSS
ncbi:hypothetical protein CCACVL1_06608 [Corchorus capsularis]|uniref:Uncharacterized protein n=1 Tax=Corchorus capsularis TaxID=210143 RepID=A0A1R3JEA5_COCAP|nr:hypothetical protein CCACVL1_06608 [Corchorus capsularis]